jgi:RND superfamily putative drug exporter
MTKILLKITNLIIHRKKTLIILWILLILTSVLIFSGQKPENLDTDIYGLEHTEAFAVKQILEKDFAFKQGNSAAIVIKSKTDIANLNKGLKKTFPQISQISEITGYKKHSNTLLLIKFKTDLAPGKMQDLTPEIRNYLKSWSEKNSTVTWFTGSTAFQYDANTAGRNDSKKGETFALLISFFILIFTFGALFSAFLPLLTGAVTLIFLHAILKLFSLPVNPVSLILGGLTGLSLAIDYSLFVVSRFKEELHNFSGQPDYREKAIGTTILYSGKTILYSGLIMLCSVSVLIIPDVSITRTVVINLLIVILVSLVNSILFLPVFLIYGEKYLDAPRILTSLINKIDKEKFWKKVISHIVNYPKVYFLLAVTILITLSLPVLNIKLFSPVITIAPQNSESIAGYEELQKDGWGGELVPISIIVKSNAKYGIYSKEFISFIFALSSELQKQEKVGEVQSITSWNHNFTKNDYIAFFNSMNVLNMYSAGNNINPLTKNNLTLINVFPKNLVNLTDNLEIIKFIHDYSAKNHTFNIITGGTVSRVNDFTVELYSYLPQMLLIILGEIYLLLFFYLKSIILPVKAAIMNFLPILSSFGLLTLVFQFGYFHNILKTPFNGAVTNIVPIVLFCIVFGLGMDYEVLILSRINESYQKNQEVKTAIIEGMSKSGSLITGAALILAGVFVPGIFSSSPQIQEICLGISSAVFIDATIVRIFLVPSFMMLMGKWNWWRPF